MARGSPLLAFVAGAGEGYLGAQRQKRRDAQDDEDRAMRRQQFDNQQEEVRQAKNLRLSLADAARPAQVEQVLIKPETMDNRDVGLPDTASMPNAGLSLAGYRTAGKTYNTAGEAQTAADAYNAPDAKTARYGQALEQGGQPLQALSLASAAQKMKQDQSKFTADQAAQAKKLRDEGVFEAVRALRAGDASGMATAFNQGGQYKLDGAPVLTKEDRDVPGIGKIPTYTAKIRMIGPDGQAVEKTYNSHDLSMQMMPYEKALELQRKGADSDNKFTYQSGILDLKNAALDAKKVADEARAARGGGGGGDRSRRDDAADEKNKIARVREDRLLIKDKIEQTLKKVENRILTRDEGKAILNGLEARDRKLAATEATPPPAPKKITTAADHAALPKGTRYIAPNGQTYIKQ